MRLSALLVFLLLSAGLHAEELLSKAQRELRARKFYFGEIDGRASEETAGAIKKFQEARGIDRSGHLDSETLRALSLPTSDANRDESKLLGECCTCILRYWQARQSDDWEPEAKFYADSVNYYDDQNVGRDFIRDATSRANRRWPRRKYTLLNRIASLLPGRSDQAQVTARVRAEVAGESGRAQVRTEDLVFRLQRGEGGWRITALKLLE
jgi:hypothetical protein